ncbi:MAG: U32 family peptidase [Lachnospiraceae bacterium]|nr:U32 family peptidase [Lachnospiraceae bacterium]
MEKPEILAPAGSMEALKAAICAGADAVYMGGSRFGARAYADNPDTEEMLEAIRYVHLRGKRLYLTVNTLVKEQEFGALYEFLAPYYEAGLDAAIVQDVGVLHFLAKEFPDLSLHASTQMTLTAAEGIRLFDKYPVTRLVPARELSLPEIKEICDNSGKEVEIFVHGALCYSYSGQCLMSSLIGGRSGNRGRCAQPCRMEYVSEEKGKKYWLSPKDLCGLSLLPELIQTGAASFKIEGRMKRPEYAAAVTAAYRKFTDLYLSLGEKGYLAYLQEHQGLLEAETESLSDIYNRGGFTTGCFLRHNGKELMSVSRPGHFGIQVGEVISGKKGEAVIELTRPVQAKDVLELRREAGDAQGQPGYYEYTLGTGADTGSRLKARLLPNLQARSGDKVYRLRNAAFLEYLNGQYVSREKRVPVTGTFYAKAGEVCRLEVTALCGEVLPAVPFPEQRMKALSVCAEGFVCERAGKLPASEEAVRKQLCKTGNEPFYFEALTIVLADEVFLPNGLLNELRRNTLSKLAEAMNESYRRTEYKTRSEKKTEEEPTEEKTDKVSVTHIDCVVSNAEQAEVAAKRAEIRRIYLDINEQDTDGIFETARELKQTGKEIWLCFPRICRKKTLMRIEASFERFWEYFDGYLIRNYETLSLVMRLDKNWMSRCALDYNMYVMNREAKAFYMDIFGNAKGVLTAPQELSYKELKVLGIQNMTMVVYGRIPLMVSVHCIKKTLGLCKGQKASEPEHAVLTDRVGKRLPIMQNCNECYNVIYNPECLYLLDRMDEVETLQPTAIRLDFTFESGEETARIIDSITGRERAVMCDGYTRGHFKRGVE